VPVFRTAEKRTASRRYRKISGLRVSPDVQCTWELWVKLRDLYKLHGIKKRIRRVYSEASIGKRYYEEMNVLSFFGYDNRLKVFTQNLDFDLLDVGASMEGYYGGRSEARIRHQIIECMHADFRSQYPTVDALMKLQDLLLAERGSPKQ
jgi:hypothetical protein